MFVDYTTQQVIDSGTVIPTQACVEADGFDTSQFQPSTIAMYSAAGVQWGMPFNVSNPVLYYNRNMFEAAGLDPEPTAAVAGGAAPVLAAARRLGRRRVRAGGRVRERLRWRVVHRAVVRQHGRALRRQRQRAAGTRHGGALRRRRRRRAADVRAVADQRRAGGLRRRQRRWRRPVAEAGRLVCTGSDGARDVGIPGHGDRHARRRARARARARGRRRRSDAGPGGAADRARGRCRRVRHGGQVRRRGGGGVGLHEVHGEPGGAIAVRHPDGLRTDARGRARHRAGGFRVPRRSPLPRRLRPARQDVRLAGLARPDPRSRSARSARSPPTPSPRSSTAATSSRR